MHPHDARSVVPAVEHLVQDVVGVVSRLWSNGGSEHSDQAFQVGHGEPGVEPDGEVRFELRVDTVDVGQGRNAGDLPALEVEVVAAEDVAEQVPSIGTQLARMSRVQRLDQCTRSSSAGSLSRPNKAVQYGQLFVQWRCGRG
jgi:hypothetical protein